MVSKFYGLTHQEVALRRDILGLPKRKGRHPVLDEAQDVALWERWKAGVTERHIALTDDMAMLALTMDLAEAMTLPMSVIRSEEHTSELQSLMRISYAVFCLKKKKVTTRTTETNGHH